MPFLEFHCSLERIVPRIVLHLQGLPSRVRGVHDHHRSPGHCASLHLLVQLVERHRVLDRLCERPLQLRPTSTGCEHDRGGLEHFDLLPRPDLEFEVPTITLGPDERGVRQDHPRRLQRLARLLKKYRVRAGLDSLPRGSLA